MSKVLTFLVALVALGAGVALFGVSESGAQGDDVTLRAERFWDEACRCYKLRFSGTIPSAAANEYVVVLQQKCGSGSATAFAGASTRQGGSWESEPVGPIARPGEDSSTYRARWNGRLSEPLTFRAKVPLHLAELGRGRYRVTVSTSSVQQSLNGRRIELQRLVAGRWTLVRRVKLRGRTGAFTAIVTARGRSQSFRVFVPARSAGPCYAATASEPFVAGRPAQPGSTAVVDRTLSCSTAVRGGLHTVVVNAYAEAGRSFPPPSANFTVFTNWTPDATLVSASTGAVQLNPTRCTAARVRVPLESRGLRGGAATSGGVQYKCESPPRVLVRIRVAFLGATKLEPDQTFGYATLLARGPVKEAAVAIQTPSGRRLAFASLSGSKARLLAAPSCVEDDP